jgi:hypothetical protein
VRHYLQDVGSTFGTGANAPREYDEGWEYLYEGDLLLKRLVTFGFYLQPWQTVRYEDQPAIGRFEAERFDPLEWKPRAPTAAFLQCRLDDAFWAAQRVLAFSDEMIRAIVKTGRYSDPGAERQLADVLITRRDTIGKAYFTRVNPLVDFALDPDGTLTFTNAAARAGVAAAPALGYSVTWSGFDNATGATTPISTSEISSAHRGQAPASVLTSASSFVKLQVSAKDSPHPSWMTPVDLYFRRTTNGWTLVGLERLP